MWLLNTATLCLEQFTGQPPPYAVLSHRWEEHQEVSFGDVTTASAHLNGHNKIVRFCKEAALLDYNYGWIDTCCIDKKSSAELSEAINSMFSWYRDAQICFAYLSDVKDIEELGQSSWFTRGWTLQELLGPPQVTFFNQTWQYLGSREKLVTKLEEIPGIPESALWYFYPQRYCVAEKMSWSANRRTTRLEDRAYCMLGLFNINMPMLYGEGSKAFQRLQEEIMKSSQDSSIFFWNGRASEDFGMLADDPSCFSSVQDLTPEEAVFDIPWGWSLSNAGISIPNVSLRPYLLTDHGSQVYLMPMTCTSLGRYEWTGFNVSFGILLEKHEESAGISRYRRVAVDGVISVDDLSSCRGEFTDDHVVYISRSPLSDRETPGAKELFLYVEAEGSLDIAAHMRLGFPQTSHLSSWPVAEYQTNGKLRKS